MKEYTPEELGNMLRERMAAKIKRRSFIKKIVCLIFGHKIRPVDYGVSVDTSCFKPNVKVTMVSVYECDRCHYDVEVQE